MRAEHRCVKILQISRRRFDVKLRPILIRPDAREHDLPAQPPELDTALRGGLLNDSERRT